jgi:RNA polymerase sigma-70 factor (ECF subfamily)
MSNEISSFTGQFSTTRWSVVLAVGQEGSSERKLALEKLCQTYWQPICVFARRRGWNDEDAEDLTQQFFARLIERNDFNGLSRNRGKFRTFLLAAFTNFLANEYDRANALKRGGGCKIISLEHCAGEEMDFVAPTGGVSPEISYDLGWAKAVLEAALGGLKAAMSTPEKRCQFDQLKQFLTTNATASDYALTAEKLGVEISNVPVLVHRMRQRYREMVRAEVAQTVSSPTELAEEMRYLVPVLNQ